MERVNIIYTGEKYVEVCFAVKEIAAELQKAGVRDFDVCHPELIGPHLIKAAIQQIGILVNSLLVTGICPAAANHRQQVQLAHHPQNRLKIHMLLLPTPDPALYPPDSICLFAMLLTLYDQVDQPLILRFLSLPFPPCVIPAAGYFKHLSSYNSTLEDAVAIATLTPSKIEPYYYADKQFEIKNQHGRVFGSYVASFRNSSETTSTSSSTSTLDTLSADDEILINDREEFSFFDKAKNVSKIKMPSANLHKLGGKAFIAKMKARGFSLQTLSNGSVIDDSGMMHWEK